MKNEQVSVASPSVVRTPSCRASGAPWAAASMMNAACTGAALANATSTPSEVRVMPSILMFCRDSAPYFKAISRAK